MTELLYFLWNHRGAPLPSAFQHYVDEHNIKRDVHPRGPDFLVGPADRNWWNSRPDFAKLVWATIDAIRQHGWESSPTRFNGSIIIGHERYGRLCEPREGQDLTPLEDYAERREMFAHMHRMFPCAKVTTWGLPVYHYRNYPLPDRIGALCTIAGVNGYLFGNVRPPVPDSAYQLVQDRIVYCQGFDIPLHIAVGRHYQEHGGGRGKLIHKMTLAEFERNVEAILPHKPLQLVYWSFPYSEWTSSWSSPMSDEELTTMHLESLDLLRKMMG